LIFYFSVKPFRAFAERQTGETKDLKQNKALKFRESLKRESGNPMNDVMNLESPSASCM
jgi:hypothetical protein